MQEYLNTQFDLDHYIDCFDETPLWSALFGLKLLENINYKPNSSVLDIGFGTGFPLTEIALRFGKSCTIYGIDPWKQAIERTRRKLEFYQITNVKLIEGVAEQIPLPNRSIDLIISNNGINNVSDINRVFTECARILKPGGQFVMTMNTDLTMFEFYTKFEQVLKELNLHQEVEAMHEHIKLKRPPVQKIIEQLQAKSFVTRNVIHDQFNYQFADATALFSHYFIRLAFMESWKKLVPEHLIETVFEKVEQLLIQDAELARPLKLSVPFVVIDVFRR
jgi:ubiquinone/menaquinone biosynthesis C-methylase UbiE